MTAIEAASAVLTIDLAAIVANWRLLRTAHGGRPTAGVVKADAYGTGVARVAPALHAAGCRHFFVAHLAEAVAIRAAVPDSLLAVLNGLLPGTAGDYVAHGITPVLGSLPEIAYWSAQARRAGRVLPALLHVDTGLARLGLEPSEVTALAEHPALLAGIAPTYVMTHLVAADVADDPVNAQQMSHFAAACARLPPAARSVANSAGLFLGPDYHSDLARPGAALYGINPTLRTANPMRPVVTLRVRVLQVRQVASGATVGYNATWRAARPSRIALAGVGYADGWPRALSNRGAACFEGVRCPLVGRVSMDLSAFDVTGLPAIDAGAWLELIGPHRDLATVAAEAQASPYEILTRLGGRYARIWHA